MQSGDNTRRRLSVDFLLNGGSDSLAASASDTTTTDAQCCDDTTSVAGGTASASSSTNTSPRSSGVHATRTTRCTDVLPPLSSLLSNSEPAVATKAAAQAQRAAHQQHGRRRSWSTGGVVRPSAFIPPLAAQSCWSGANPPPERRPVVTVATSGPLARGPPPAAAGAGQSSGFFLPINALPVVLDIDRDFEAAEREHRQRQLHQHQQLHQQRQQFQRQRRPQLPHRQHTAMTLAMMQKRKREQQLKAGELDQDEVEVARTLADPNRWVSSAHQRPTAAAAGRDHHPPFAAEAETVMSPAEDARRMQHYHHQAKRRRHSACAPTLVAEAQRLFSSHLAATPILPASEAKELAAAKYGTAGATSSAVDPMDETNTTATTAAEQPPAVDAAMASTNDTTTAASNVNVNDNAPPAIAPTFRKAEAFQFSPDQQDLLLQVLERTQQREAQRSSEAAGAHNSEMDIAREGRSSSISSGGGSSSTGGSSSGDDGEVNEDDDEAARLQRMAKKRKRVNAQQLAVLEECFAVDPMPNTLAKLKLAETLGMSPKRVQIWFQNKRARLKKGEQKKLQDALQQQTNHARPRLLTYHNLRIDDSGHIVIKDPISADGGGESVTPTASATSPAQNQFVPIVPQPTTTASAM
jgi:uncharacterized membrane protein YgcG